MSEGRDMDTDIIVVGAGPVGLMLASELALAGVKVMVLEKLAEPSAESKSLSLQPRTAEILDLRGLLARADEQAMGHICDGHFSGIPVIYKGLDTRYPRQVSILQKRLEAVLEERVAKLGGEIRRNWEVTGLEQDEKGVTVVGSQTLQARYVVGCDGAHSSIRNLLGVAFLGTDTTQYSTIVDIILEEGTAMTPDRRMTTGISETRKYKPDGRYASLIPLDQPTLYRFVYFDGRREDTQVTIEEVTNMLHTFYGDEYKLVEIQHVKRFSDSSRQADKYRVGRVFLAGDAAHIHPPTGGQGLNLGLQDVFNLAWKLAAVISNSMPDILLDTYHSERHPVGERILDTTRAMDVLRKRKIENVALRKIITELLEIPEANLAMAKLTAGLDINYGGIGHVGKRLPDFPIANGWASDLFHSGEGVLLTTDERYLIQAKPWRDRVNLVLLEKLPWSDVEAVLVRPDGYVCWTATGEEVSEALKTWFGAATEE